MSAKTSGGLASLAERPQILLDRCVAMSLAEVLRKSGLHCTTLAEVYGVDKAQHVEDVTWIEWAAVNGYAVITANPRILSVPYENEAIKRYGTKVFCIANPNVTKEARSFIIGRHILSILRKMKTDEACFWRLYLGSPIKYDF